MTDTNNSHTPIVDPIQAGLAAGWKVIDAATLTDHLQLEADVAIVGTRGGGVYCRNPRRWPD